MLAVWKITTHNNVISQASDYIVLFQASIEDEIQ